VLDNKKDRSTPALTQARDDMLMLLAVLTPTIGANRWIVTNDLAWKDKPLKVMRQNNSLLISHLIILT
jgi:hypothetical protein